MTDTQDTPPLQPTTLEHKDLLLADIAHELQVIHQDDESRRKETHGQAARTGFGVIEVSFYLEKGDNAPALWAGSLVDALDVIAQGLCSDEHREWGDAKRAKVFVVYPKSPTVGPSELNLHHS